MELVVRRDHMEIRPETEEDQGYLKHVVGAGNEGDEVAITAERGPGLTVRLVIRRKAPS